ncbi:hypothetical protein D9M70_593260 [compost metagenome]
MAGRLHPVQHHDLNETAGMQARCGRVEADIGRHDFLPEQFIQARLVGDLVDETTLAEGVKEIGLETGHDLSLLRGSF